MSSFGADIGAILRTSLAPLHKLVAMAVRYHHPEGAPASRIEEVTGLSRAMTYQVLGALSEHGVAVKTGVRWRFKSPCSGLLGVHAVDTDVHGMDTPVHAVDTKVHGMEIPQTPYKEFQTFSRPFPDLAAAASASPPETAEDDGREFRALVDAWWDTQTGPGKRAKGSVVPDAVVGDIHALLKAHKADRLRWAIARAREISSTPGPRLLAKLCEEGPRTSDLGNGTPTRGGVNAAWGPNWQAEYEATVDPQARGGKLTPAELQEMLDE